MIRLSLSFDHHVIDVSIHSFILQWLEHLRDHTLVVGLRILKPKGHDLIVEKCRGGDNLGMHPRSSSGNDPRSSPPIDQSCARESNLSDKLSLDL